MIYLKADDKETFNLALVNCGWIEEVANKLRSEDVIIAYTATRSLDVIGLINVETGETITVEATDITDEYSYPETELVDGWHANLLLHGEELPSELSGFVIDSPSNPVRRFA
jgi:hypothetical protein